MTELNNVDGIAVDRLESFIERVERLTEEKKALQTDIKEIYSEAKSAGFDVKIMKVIVKLRGMDSSDREEMEYLTDSYKLTLNL